MAMQIHSPESMQLAADLAFAAAKAVADEHGLGLVVILVDAVERVQYKSNLGPTMTSGALVRCAALYDKPTRPVNPQSGGGDGRDDESYARRQASQ